MAEFGDEILRKLRAEDLPAAFQLSAQAGWNQTEKDWRMLLDLAPESCFAIEVAGQLVATTTLLCYGQRLAWIGMVLTKPELQRRGFAKRLLTHVLAQADQIGIETVKLDATDQGQPLYEQFGFRPEQEVERWSRTGTDVAQFPAVRHAKEVWRRSDSDAFGVDRSQLLEKLAQRNPPLLSARSYLFARQGRVATYLGPSVSEDPQTARHLIEHYVQNTICNWYWDLFSRNRNAAAIARDLGFMPQRYLRRMTRGKELRENENAIYAIAGFELG
jgi:GNAT superfamily N-acetyltransferase